MAATNWGGEEARCRRELKIILSVWLDRLEHDEEPASQEELAMYNKVRQLLVKEIDENYMSQLSSVVARLWGSILDEAVVRGYVTNIRSSLRMALLTSSTA